MVVIKKIIGIAANVTIIASITNIVVVHINFVTPTEFVADFTDLTVIFQPLKRSTVVAIEIHEPAAKAINLPTAFIIPQIEGHLKLARASETTTKEPPVRFSSKH